MNKTKEVSSYYVPGYEGMKCRVVIWHVPAHLSLAVAVQDEFNLDHHIIRDVDRDGTSMLGEMIQKLDGRRAWVGRDLRDDMATESEMVRRFENANLDLRVRGVAGNANVTMNPAFLVWKSGKLTGTRFDVNRIESSDPEFAGVVIARDGTSRFSNHIRFVRKDAALATFAVRIDGKDQSEAVHAVICGPQLVCNGEEMTAKKLRTSICNREWYDLRHTIVFPYLKWPTIEVEGFAPKEELGVLSINPGLEAFWNDGTLNESAVDEFLAGRPVKLDLRPYTDKSRGSYFDAHKQAIGLDRLLDIFHQRGYTQADGDGDPGVGEYKRDGDTLFVTFYPGVYNHSLVGLDADGGLMWMGVSGLGGRSGMTVIDTARLAAENGFANAIVCDNGGDVHLRLREAPDQFDLSTIIGSPYDRNQFRGILLFVEKKDDRGTRFDLPAEMVLPASPIAELDWPLPGACPHNARYM